MPLARYDFVVRAGLWRGNRKGDRVRLDWTPEIAEAVEADLLRFADPTDDPAAEAAGPAQADGSGEPATPPTTPGSSDPHDSDSGPAAATDGEGEVPPVPPPPARRTSTSRKPSSSANKPRSRSK